MSDQYIVPPGVEHVEVRGEVVLAILDSMQHISNEALTLLGRQGITDPRPNAWFPLGALLAAFADLVRDKSGTLLFSIGHKIRQNARMPADYDSLTQALSGIDEAYHLNHRGGEIGHYLFDEQGRQHVTMISTSLYPCEFDRGVLSGFASASRPLGVDKIYVNHAQDSPCRGAGGASCTYHVTW